LNYPVVVANDKVDSFFGTGTIPDNPHSSRRAPSKACTQKTIQIFLTFAISFSRDLE